AAARAVARDLDRLARRTRGRTAATTTRAARVRRTRPAARADGHRLPRIEARSAQHRPVVAGLEGHQGLGAALGADRGEHRLGAAVAAAHPSARSLAATRRPGAARSSSLTLATLAAALAA